AVSASANSFFTPVVSAGSAQTITLPASSVTLRSTASDPDGSIASYQWTKVSGNGGSFSSTTSYTTNITGLTAGAYVFNVKVTDNQGATANSSVGVTVNGTTGGGGGGTRANLLQDANFDGSNAFTGFSLSGHQYCCDYSITQVASPDGAAGKVLKYDLRSTDAIVSGSKRAEIESGGNDAPQTSERWYGLRYYLQKYDADNGAESIIQWHDVDGTTPPLSIQVAGGRMRIMQSFTSGNIPTDLGATTTGRWISIVIHVKWTTGTTGVLEVWRDGVKMVNKVNVRTNSNGGSYMKLGINKWSWAPGGGSSSATQRIFYIDNFRMGNENATYNDVAP
ncbi:MAG: heparin lyase I family protein, partial [Chitinophagaceae bacterium]